MNTDRRNFPAPQRIPFHEWCEGDAFTVAIQIRSSQESGPESRPAPVQSGRLDDLMTNIVVRLQLNRQQGDEPR